jgi:hypothetical protein
VVTAAEREAGKARKPRSAKNVKRECKEKIIAEMDQIVSGLIEKAKRGSYNEAKLLLTIADTDEGKGAEEKAAEAARWQSCCSGSWAKPGSRQRR